MLTKERVIELAKYYFKLSGTFTSGGTPIRQENKGLVRLLFDKHTTFTAGELTNFANRLSSIQPTAFYAIDVHDGQMEVRVYI